MSDLMKFAFTGINIIPSVLLILIVLYWITVIIGAMDIDVFDIDLDVGEGGGVFYSILSFLNIGQIPVMLIVSLLILNFWIAAMMLFSVPMVPGGWINAALHIPAFIISVIVTKIVSNPLRGLFKFYEEPDNDTGCAVIEKKCTLMNTLKSGRIGQAKVHKEGADILVNVKSEVQGETFEKGEQAIVIRKDSDKNIYYLVKMEEKKYDRISSGSTN